MKRILILGSTGSIGVNTLNVLKSFPGKYKVEGLVVGSNIMLLEQQIYEFNPSFAVVSDRHCADKLRLTAGSKCRILSGKEGILEAVISGDYDILVNALVGFAGVAPTIEAIKRGKRIALANKETLVAAGEFITVLCKQYNSEIIPIDSEHSAILQCLVGENTDEVEKLIITASGGPFFNRDRNTFENITLSEALNHPNWKMGNKITIDSATMMNKGFEVIEAHWLFGLACKRIEVVIHPQSIVHSMVEFVDGSIKAQLGMPDMKLPIQYALSYPERLKLKHAQTRFPGIKNLTFFEPDYEKFECMKLAYDVIEAGGTAPCVLNASNEIAVSKFLNGDISFVKIPEIIKKSLDSIKNNKLHDIESIFECDKQTREFASKIC